MSAVDVLPSLLLHENSACKLCTGVPRDNATPAGGRAVVHSRYASLMPGGATDSRLALGRVSRSWDLA